MSGTGKVMTQRIVDSSNNVFVIRRDYENAFSGWLFVWRSAI